MGIVAIVGCVAAGIIVALLPDPDDIIDWVTSRRMADRSGYSTRQLRRITGAVLRQDRRRRRYGPYGGPH